MKALNSLFVFLYLSLYSNVLYSKEVKSSMKSLESSLKTDVAVPLAGVGLVVAAIFFFMGRQDASQRFSQVIVGLVILACAGGIVAFAMKVG